MSTLAYAALTAKRQTTSAGESTTSGQPGMKTYVDVLAALVPAEVLAAHAAVLGFTTKQKSVCTVSQRPPSLTRHH